MSFSHLHLDFTDGSVYITACKFYNICTEINQPGVKVST
jgi:hypothetical protein